MRNRLILAAIIILGLALRLYKIDNPIADWHSWRQADTTSGAVLQNVWNLYRRMAYLVPE